MAKKLTQSQVIKLLKKHQGERSLRQFARDIGTSAAYLSHIYAGKREPGPAVLEKLGLQKELVYSVAR
jgi:transcriptional regulator with XRE-family HTH domain